MDHLRRDIRMAVRTLLRSPGPTGLAVMSIALGVGLTTAVFSIGDSLVLRPFPFDRPGELLQVRSIGEDGQPVPYGWPDCQAMTSAGADVVDIATYQRRGGMLTVGTDVEPILVHAVTPNYFSLLGVRAALGQASVLASEGRPAVVLDHRFWQRRFLGDPSIVGKAITVGGKALSVAGVMPPAVTGPVRGIATDVWVGMDAWFDVLGARHEREQPRGQFEMVARLKPRASIEQAALVLERALRAGGVHGRAPEGMPGTALRAVFAPTWTTSLRVGGGLLLGLGLVLFVACANVAQLRIAQAEGRRREFGIRLALGGGAGQLVRQLLVEAALVSAVGAAVGLVLAHVIGREAAEVLSAGRAFVDYRIGLDSRVLGFTLTSTVLATILTGLLPARHALRLNLNEILKAEQVVPGAERDWRKTLLVVGQMATTVALIGVALLFAQSLVRAASTRPGLDTGKSVLIVSVRLAGQRSTASWAEAATRHLAGLPGVKGATFARRVPLSGSGGGATVRVEVPGRAPQGVHFNNVGGSYFSVMGTRVVRGRGITPDDRDGSLAVVAVSEKLAEEVFGGRDPLGELLTIDGTPRHVVGIVENAPSNDLHEPPEPYLYLPFAQVPSGDVTLLIESAGSAVPMADAIRSALRGWDPSTIVLSTTSLRDHLDRALAWDRAMAALTVGLGLFGILLTTAGLFGVVQYLVSRRTREFGVRLALGATARQVQGTVLAEALRAAVWGIALGIVLLGLTARLVRSMVVGIDVTSPSIYVAGAITTLGMALLAAWLPAWRAARVDPVRALRNE